jgi:signal transduction histidine kinase
MPDLIRELLSTEGFHPHGYCYLWKPGLIWLHVVSDVLIGLAYVAIGWALVHFVRRGRGELPFSGMFVAFGIFIAACGATHFVEVWTLWTPVYWFAGGVKVVTAAASVFTALALPPLVPVALATLASARVSEKRREDLEDAHRRLTEVDELKTQFFSNVSHELRTPLTLILGPVDQILARPDLPADDRRRLETVRRNADLLLHHVNDLLDVAKLEAGKVGLTYRRTDLANVVRLAAAHFESVGMTRAVSLGVESPEALPAEADPDLLGRILFNLLGNAVKFTPAGGRVRCVLEMVGAAPRGGAGAPLARITVHDSGPGVPPEARKRIFEPFRQGDGGTARRHGGTGLGLAIVAELVELHGGTVRVEDSPLGGAAFIVELPLRAPEGVAVEEAREGGGFRAAGEYLPPPIPAAERPAEDEAEASGADVGRPLVLVVEDNPEMNRFIAEALSGEYRTAHAFDGGEGIAKAEALRPDLIVSDLMMPEVTGDVLVREVRGKPALDATPILLLSARADDDARVRLLQAGVQDYLTKPFTAAELRARVGNWIRMKRARDILQRELASTMGDVEALAGDIAARKRELETALEAARLAFAEAEAASRAKSDFVGVMSHELRTPLNAITGYVELLGEGLGGELTDAQRKYVERIRSSARHLLSLVDEVLEFARVEAATVQVREESVDLRTVVEEAAGLVEPLAAGKGLALHVRTPGEPVIVTTDAPRLRQVLVNLTENAVKFTSHGEVSVSLERRGDQAVLQVRDTGPGIPEEHLEKIFDPFWQADASNTRQTGGTGLGLAITRRLVDLLGGEIHVESAPGSGSTFVVRIPL